MIGRLGLLFGAAGLAATLAVPAVAQDVPDVVPDPVPVGQPAGATTARPNDALATAAALRTAFVDAVRQGVGSGRGAALESLFAQFRRLESQAQAPASEAGAAAATALALLAREGVTADSVGLMLLDATLPSFDGTPAAEAATIEIILALRNPSHRTTAWLALADAIGRRGHPDRTAVLTGRAIEDGITIPDIDGRAAALDAVVEAVTRDGDATAVRYAWPTLAAVPDARFRANAVATLTKGTLAARPTAGDPTVEEAQRLVDAGDFVSGLAVAVAAIGAEGGEAAQTRRKALIDDFVERDAVIEAVLLAASARDRSDQDPLLADIAARLVDRDRALRALPVARLVIDGGSRARALTAVAERLRKRGFDTASRALVDEAIASARTVEDAERRATALAAVGRRLAAIDPTKARALAGEIGDRGERDRVLSAVAKALGDAGRTDEALGLARGLGEPDERAAGIAAAARSLARSGNVAGALDLLGEISKPDASDRALAAIARAEAKAGDDEAAFGHAAKIADAKDRTDALMEIAEAAGDRATTVDQAITLARAAAAAAKEPADRDAALAALGVGLAGLGKTAEAEDVRTKIDAPDARGRVGAAIAAAFARQKQFDKAAAAAGSIEAPAEREVAEAEIGVAMAAEGDLAGGLARVRALDDDQTRVKAFRRIAEEQARKLDGWKALGGAPAPANATPPPIVAHDAVYEDKTLTVGPTPAKMVAGIAGVPMPSFATTAADVRRRMPLPTTAGDADVTPIRYNQFNDKFLQEAARTVGQPILVGLQRDLNPFYINLDRGVFTLGDVYRKLLAAGQTRAIERVGQGYLVRLPILVGPEATLVLGGEDVDEVRLGSDTGAFLVVAGTLYAVDTRIVAYSEKLGGPDLRKDAEGKVFRPFVAAWSDSEMHIAGSTLIALGYPAGKAYGLSFTAGPVSLVRVRSAPKPPTGTVVENTFINNLYGFYSYEAAGVEVIGNEYRDNIVYGVDPHDRSHDLRIAYNTLYGTKKKHGLIISREVDESFLVGNIAFDNAGSGIMLDRDSTSNTIYANSAINNVQDGLTFFESSCNVVMANLFADNGRSGVRIRNSWDIGLFANTIRANKRSGIDAYVSDLHTSDGSEARDFVLDPYTPLVTFHSERDTIDGNGSAVTTRGATAMTIAEDSFSHHGNKIIRGDFAAVSTQIVQYSGRGGVRAMSTCRPKKPEMACKLRTLGLLPADDSLVIFDPAGDADCTTVEGSQQKAAFAPDPEEATR